MEDESIPMEETPLQKEQPVHEKLLEDFVTDKGIAHPKPVPLKSLKTHYKCCYSWWSARMPFYINFPMALFLITVAAFLAVCTIFVGLEMGGVGVFTLGNAPVWTWAAWIVVNIFVFFVLWGIFWSIRQIFIRKSYRAMKITYALWGLWAPLVVLIFAICNFPLLELLVVWNVDPIVTFWISRIIWTILVFAVFWIVWEICCRFFIIRIERDRMWNRIAKTLWREKMLTILLNALKKREKEKGNIIQKQASRIAQASKFGKAYDESGMLSLEEFEVFKGRILDETTAAIDVPSVLLAPSRAEQREVRVCRLAVNASLMIFKKFDDDGSDSIELAELEKMFGTEGALEQLSLWDPSGDGSISRHEMVGILLEMFQDREDLVRTLKSRQPLAKILAIALGAILGFVALIIILQIYEIQVVDLVLPLLAFVLPLGFIFGRTIQIMWESFVVLFILQPWMKGDFITSSGQSLTVNEISLYTTEGYDVYGVFTTIPNQAALSGIVQNFGRSVPGRLRVYFRIAVEKPGSEAYIVKQLSEHMRKYCDERRKIFLKDAFSSWLENSDFSKGEFDDLRAITICMNVGFTGIRPCDLDALRAAKSKFLNELRSAIAETNARGFSSGAMQVILDASSVPMAAPNSTVDL